MDFDDDLDVDDDLENSQELPRDEEISGSPHQTEIPSLHELLDFDDIFPHERKIGGIVFKTASFIPENTTEIHSSVVFEDSKTECADDYSLNTASKTLHRIYVAEKALPEGSNEVNAEYSLWSTSNGDPNGLSVNIIENYKEDATGIHIPMTTFVPTAAPPTPPVIRYMGCAQ